MHNDRPTRFPSNDHELEAAVSDLGAAVADVDVPRDDGDARVVRAPVHSDPAAGDPGSSHRVQRASRPRIQRVLPV